MSERPARTPGMAPAVPLSASDESIERIAAKFGVTSLDVRSKFDGVADSTWKLLARVDNPPPWDIFIEKLDDRLSSRDLRPRKGLTSKNDAPSFREVDNALHDAVQQDTHGRLSTVPSTAQTNSGHDLRGSSRTRSSANDFSETNQAERDGRQPNGESSPNAQRPRMQRTETESAIPSTATAMVEASAPQLVLRLIRDYGEEATVAMNEIKVPAVARAETMEKLDAQIRECFQRFRCLRPTDDNKSIEDDIIRHAGERRMLEVNGLRDAEITYGKQTASVLQKLSDQLITALGPAVVTQSLQKIGPQSLEYIANHLFNGAHPLPETAQSRVTPSLRHEHQPIESVLEPLHNDACHSPVDAEQCSRNKRHREGSSDCHDREKRTRTTADNQASTDAASVPGGDACTGEAAEHDSTEKDKIRRSGRSLLRKSKELAAKARVFVATVYWDPVHECHRVAAGLPEGQTIPDLNRLVAEELIGCQPEHKVQREEPLARRRPLRRSAGLRQTRAHEPAGHDVYTFRGASEGLTEAETRNESGNGSDNGGDVSYDCSSDAEPLGGSAAARNEWMIHQVKTPLFTSAESVEQCWRWVKEDQLLRYVALRNTKTAEWGVDHSEFNVRMEEVAEVRGSVKSLRVRLVMQQNFAISGQDQTPRGDIMVVFKTEEITRQFLRFCRDRSITVVEQEPPVMVHLWRNMESATVLPNGE